MPAEEERLKPLGLAAAALVLLPFLLVTFLPVTDLPQHVAQLRLLEEWMRDPSGPYVVSWLSPNGLVYAVLGVFWLVLPPVAAGRAGTAVLALSWVAAAFAVARVRRRPPEHAVLAAILTFNLSLYWGFLNFLVGWPVFVAWVLVTLRPAGRGNWWALAALSALLYGAHALWFAAGAGWLVLRVAAGWEGWRPTLARLSALVPVGVAAAFWYPSLVASRTAGGFDLAPHWVDWPLSRIGPEPFASSLLGGLRGGVEPLVVALLAAWIGAVLVTRRRELREETDGLLLLAAAPFLVAYLVGPDKYMNTLGFAQRWLAPGTVLLLLALPAPRLGRTLRLALPLVLLGFFSLVTARSWMLVESLEMEGLESSLEALPGGGSVLGLDFGKESLFVRGRPFLQTFAWSQALGGSELNFSFAAHGSSVVRFRESRPTPWSPGMEWFAERATRRDLRFFDHVLVNGGPEVHGNLGALPELVPVTAPARWRLYRVEAPPAPPAAGREDTSGPAEPPAGESGGGRNG